MTYNTYDFFFFYYLASLNMLDVMMKKAHTLTVGIAACIKTSHILQQPRTHNSLCTASKCLSQHHGHRCWQTPVQTNIVYRKAQIMTHNTSQLSSKSLPIQLSLCIYFPTPCGGKLARKRH